MAPDHPLATPLVKGHSPSEPKCIFAAEEYILTVRRQGSLVFIKRKIYKQIIYISTVSF